MKKSLLFMFSLMLIATIVIAQGTQHTTEQISNIMVQQDPDIDGDLNNNKWWTLVNLLTQNNFSATTPPTSTDDADSGYSVGSVWINTSADNKNKIFYCVDNTVGAAVWVNQIDEFEGFSNPMTSSGDIMVGGDNGVAQRIPASPNSYFGWDANGDPGAFQNIAITDASHQIEDDTDSTRRVRFILDALNSGRLVNINIPNDNGGTIAYEAIRTNQISGSTTLTESDCFHRKVHYLTGPGTVTLPVVKEGMDFFIRTIGNISGIVAPPSTNNFIYNGIATQNGEVAQNNSIAGEYWHLTYYDNDSYYLESNIGGSGGTPIPTSCDIAYSAAVETDQTIFISDIESRSYTGGIYIPPVDRDICKIDVYISILRVDGNQLPSNQDYYCRIYSINQSTLQFISVLGTSNKIDAENILPQSMLSTSAGYFEFSIDVPVTAGQKYAILVFNDMDGNLNDAPELTPDSHPRLAMQIGGGTNMARVYYNSSGVANNYNPVNPIKIDVYSKQ